MERLAQECLQPAADHRSRSSGKAFAVTSMIGVRRAWVLNFGGTIRRPASMRSPSGMGVHKHEVIGGFDHIVAGRRSARTVDSAPQASEAARDGTVSGCSGAAIRMAFFVRSGGARRPRPPSVRAVAICECECRTIVSQADARECTWKWPIPDLLQRICWQRDRLSARRVQRSSLAPRPEAPTPACRAKKQTSSGQIPAQRHFSARIGRRRPRQQRLLHPSRVAHHLVSQSFVDECCDLDALSVCARTEKRDSVLDQRCQRKWPCVEALVDGIHLGKITNLLDECQQRICRCLDRPLFRGQVGIENVVGHSNRLFIGARISSETTARNRPFAVDRS
jgi:hypothetical protein